MSAAFPDLHLIGFEGGIPVDVQLLVNVVKVRKGDRILDLGTGTGAIALALAASADVCVLGIDTGRSSIAMAEKNLERNRAAIRGEVCFQQLNVTQIRSSHTMRSFNIVVANPPYYKRGAGRVSPYGHRERARREGDATFDDFARAAASALPHKGRFYFVHTASRLVELFVTLRVHDLEPKHLVPVYPRQRRRAELIVVEAIKGAKPGVTLLTPRVI